MTNNHPHPNPKDVAKWLGSIGFEYSVITNSWTKKPGEFDRMVLRPHEALYFYTIYHTALTSFRDELLAAGPEVVYTLDEVRVMNGHLDSRTQQDLLAESTGFMRDNQLWRKAIQTISGKYGL